MGDAIIHISSNLHTRFKDSCKLSGVSMKDVVRGMVEEYLRKEAMDVIPLKKCGPKKDDPYSKPPFWSKSAVPK